MQLRAEARVQERQQQPHVARLAASSGARDECQQACPIHERTGARAGARALERLAGVECRGCKGRRTALRERAAQRSGRGGSGGASAAKRSQQLGRAFRRLRGLSSSLGSAGSRCQRPRRLCLAFSPMAGSTAAVRQRWRPRETKPGLVPWHQRKRAGPCMRSHMMTGDERGGGRTTASRTSSTKAWYERESRPAASSCSCR